MNAKFSIYVVVGIVIAASVFTVIAADDFTSYSDGL